MNKSKWGSKINIPCVTECKHGNCSTHFPQFTEVTEEELFKTLRRVLDEPEDSYFHTAYKNSKNLVEVYKEALTMPFLKACELINNTPNSYIRYDMYLSLQPGRVLSFVQCCR